jgi:signal transduction histidine kinase
MDPQDSYFPAELVRRLYDVTRRVQSSEDLPAVLEEIARGVTEGLGFGVAAISRLEGDQLVIVAVAGPDELRDHFIGRRIPAQRVLQREFSIADHWGILRFVPHNRQDEATLESLWVPDIEVGQEPDDWHPLDTLYGPLYSPTGELIGNMAVDLPPNNKVPNAQQRELLEMFVVQAGIALANAQHRDRLQLQVRLSEAFRALDTVGGEEVASMDLMLAQACEALAQATGTSQVTARCFPDPFDDREYLGGWPASPRARDELVTALTSDLRRLGERKQFDPIVVTVADDAAHATTSLPESVGLLREHLEQNGWLRGLVCPIVADRGVLGYFVGLHAEGERGAFAGQELEAFRLAGREAGMRVRDARLRRAEGRLVAELREVDRYKGELIATISHELKTPLTSIIGHTELLSDDHPDSPSVSAISRNAARLDRLISNLLNYSRMQSRRELSRAPLDLGEVVRSTVDMLRVQAEGHGVTLRIDLPDTPLIVQGDAEELPRVVDNLCSNAVKYTPAGGEVSVSMRLVQGYAEVVVADTGLGISKADRAHLFSAFHRSTNPDALTIPGTGLGLAIARTIVEGHGGQILVESELGQGSTFTLRIPAG